MKFNFKRELKKIKPLPYSLNINFILKYAMVEKDIRRKFLNITLTIAVLGGSAHGVLGSSPVKRSLQALNTVGFSCNESIGEANSYDLIAVFGLDDPDENTSPDQKSAVLTQAATAYVTGKSDKIIVIGNIDGVLEKNLRHKIKTKIKSLSDGKVSVGKNNIDFINHAVTYAQGMEGLLNLNKTVASPSVYGVSSVLYSSRLKLLAEIFGVKMTLASAECQPESMPVNNIVTDQDVLIAEKMGIIYSAFDPHWNIATRFKTAIKKLK